MIRNMNLIHKSSTVTNTNIFIVFYLGAYLMENKMGMCLNRDSWKRKGKARNPRDKAH